MNTSSMAIRACTVSMKPVASNTPNASVEQAWQAGRMLALLHTAAEGFHAPQRATHLLVARDDLIRAEDPIAALTAQLPDRPGLAAYLADTPWQAELQRVRQQLPALQHRKL